MIHKFPGFSIAVIVFRVVSSVVTLCSLVHRGTAHVVDSNVSKEHGASFTLKTEAVCSSEMLVFRHMVTTKCHIPKDHNWKSQRQLNLM
jgi:hypothetical protein